MKKIAIFLEGTTECIFVEQLIKSMIESKRLKIDKFDITGGSRNSPRKLNLLYKSQDNQSHEFYIQLMISRNDERVGSDIRDLYESLVKVGFSAIIGIRDVYPQVSPADLNVFRRALRHRIKTNPIDPLFVLGVMEVEAWFISEHTHFQKIHPNLTCDRISQNLGFDPSSDDIKNRPCPHQDLHLIYQLEGFSYRKTGSQIQRTVNCLDYTRVYFHLVNNFEDLKKLIDALDAFFDPALVSKTNN